jgi:hypothetical protein
VAEIPIPQVIWTVGGRPPDCIRCGDPIDPTEEHAVLVSDPARPRATVIAAAHASRFVGDDDDVDDACLRALRLNWATRCAGVGWHCLLLESGDGGERLWCGGEALHAGTPLEVLLDDGHVVSGTYEYTLVGGIRPWLYFELGGFGSPRVGVELPAEALVHLPEW